MMIATAKSGGLGNYEARCNGLALEATRPGATDSPLEATRLGATDSPLEATRPGAMNSPLEATRLGARCNGLAFGGYEARCNELGFGGYEARCNGLGFGGYEARRNGLGFGWGGSISGTVLVGLNGVGFGAFAVSHRYEVLRCRQSNSSAVGPNNTLHRNFVRMITRRLSKR